MEWFNNNKEEIYYEIQYVRNTKNGKKGEVKQKGYKLENICYKIKWFLIIANYLFFCYNLSYKTKILSTGIIMRAIFRRYFDRK